MKKPKMVWMIIKTCCLIEEKKLVMFNTATNEIKKYSQIKKKDLNGDWIVYDKNESLKQIYSYDSEEIFTEPE